MRTIDALLGEVTAFGGLSSEHLELIAGCARNRSFQSGELLMREGERADVFYVLRHGSVALETFASHRGSIIVETLHEGDLVGWSWLVPPYSTMFDARAVEHVSAVAFDGACLRGKCDEDPVLGYALMRRFTPIIVERLEATRLQLLDVYGHVGGG